MRVTTFEELKDRHLGVIGTCERDAYEAEVKEAIHTMSKLQQKSNKISNHALNN